MLATGSDKLEQAILRTVTYVDGYDFPLTLAEIHRYLAHERATVEEVDAALATSPLLGDALFRDNNYYMLRQRTKLAAIRQTRLQNARSVWPQAIAFAAQMARLPFARMVAITGSLAVDNVTGDFDIDFLIVTEDDSVWLCRAFAVALVRLAALRGVELCPNYFVSESALAFPERNMYTAHEVTQMVPLHGLDVYAELRRQNDWTVDFLPNAAGPPQPVGMQALDPRQLGRATRGVKRAAETLLRTAPGRQLERWEMERKIKKLATEGQWQESYFSSSCCKGHFHHHQSEAIASYNARLLKDLT